MPGALPGCLVLVLETCHLRLMDGCMWERKSSVASLASRPGEEVNLSHHAWLWPGLDRSRDAVAVARELASPVQQTQFGI